MIPIGTKLQNNEESTVHQRKVHLLISEARFFMCLEFLPAQ